MAHYALLDSNNIVINVIAGRDEDEESTYWEEYYSKATGYKCLRTSYNTFLNAHAFGGTGFRKNYAIIGGYYDESRDAFIAPKDFPSWVLDEQTCGWIAPEAYPSDANEYEWDELLGNWYKIPAEEEIENGA